MMVMMTLVSDSSNQEQVDQEAIDDIERINELRHPQVHHQWIYHIDHSEGTGLTPGHLQRRHPPQTWLPIST